ncbi:MAG: FAD-dependent oxidoreductase [Pseudomonadota bacterium]
MDEVTIIGGGIAGLAAALRLAERGRRVTVIEADAELGGKLGARFDASTGEHHEHAYHMYLNWYLNFWALVDQLGVRDRFEPRHHIQFLKAGEFPHTHHITDVGAIETVWANVNGGVVPPADMFIYAYSLLDLMTRRYDRDAFLDRVSVNGFMSSRPYATDAAAEQHSRTLAKAFASYSYRTSAASYRRFIALGAAEPSPMMWVMTGNVYDVLIKPLEAALVVRGVRIRKNTRVDRLLLNNRGHISALAVSQMNPGHSLNGAGRRALGSGTLDVHGPVICTIPPDRLACLVDDPVYQSAPELHTVARLNSEPMTSISLRFKRRLPSLPSDHVVLMDSRYELTFIDNSQLWPDLDHTFLNVVASDADHFFNLSDDAALQSVLAELQRFIPFQLDDVDFARTRIRFNEDAPLFLNEVGSWKHRPATRTSIDNLFLAGDYCRNEIDVVTIEGAMVSAYHAARAVLEQGSPAAPLPIPLPPEYPMARAHLLKTLLTPQVYWAKSWSWLTPRDRSRIR